VKEHSKVKQPYYILCTFHRAFGSCYLTKTLLPLLLHLHLMALLKMMVHVMRSSHCKRKNDDGNGGAYSRDKKPWFAIHFN
jgi:quinol-cytochrome oxidoreductase complex cytochrome b subunit